MRLNEAWNFYKEVSEEEEEIKYSGLVKFFIENPHPTEDQIHDLAEDMGMSTAEVEERMFSLLSSLLRGIGKSNHVPDEHFDQEQLKKGIEIEKEHTEDDMIAKMIAKDHLNELPDYYDRLEDMEDEAEQQPFSIRDSLPDDFGDEYRRDVE